MLAFEISADVGLRYVAGEFSDAQFFQIVRGYEARVEHEWDRVAWQTSHLLNQIRAAVGVKGEPVTGDQLLGRKRTPPPPQVAEE